MKWGEPMISPVRVLSPTTALVSLAMPKSRILHDLLVVDLREEDVPRLEIAVHDPRLVRAAEGARNLREHRGRLLEGEAAHAVQAGAEILPL